MFTRLVQPLTFRFIWTDVFFCMSSSGKGRDKGFLRAFIIRRRHSDGHFDFDGSDLW